MLDSPDKVFDFKIALEENLKRKPLTDPEIATAIAEYEELKRKIYGSKDKKQTLKQFQSDGHTVTNGWSERETAKDLGISKTAVSKAKKIAEAIQALLQCSNSWTKLKSRHKK